MKSTLFFIAFCIHIGLFAQQAKLNKANQYFRELNFQSAVQLYEQILKKGTKPQALFNLSHSYRRIGDTKKAEYWYAQSILHPECTPEMYVYLAQALLSNNKPIDAKRQLEKFLSLQPTDVRAKNLLRSCNDTVRQELENAGSLYQVKAIEEINTPNDDFGATFYRRGMVFCTEKDTGGAVLRRSGWTGRPFVDMFFTTVRLVDEDKMEFKFSRAESFAPELRTKWHDGPLCFTADQSTMYLTKNNLDGRKARYANNGIINTKIVSSKKTGDSWTTPLNVSFANPNFSVMHPALTPDGFKMFFASDMSGGFGGYDLYVSYNENGSWSAPVNLGPGINTEGDELFPYVSKEGLLYFSSDGHTGMGGYDIYYSRAVRGIWNPVSNVGAPLNSNKDDFGFVMDSTRKYGFFSSNREGGKGFTDIYLFKKISVDAEILVFDKVTGEGLDSVLITCDCYPKKTFTTNVDGKLYLELPANKTCNFVFNSPAGEKEVAISTQNYAIGSQIFEQVPIQIDEGLTFAVEGIAMNKDNNAPVAMASITLLNSCNNTTQSYVTDAQGKFNFKLEPNCCYVARGQANKFFTATTSFCTKGLYRSDTFDTKILLPPFLTINGKNTFNDTTSFYGVKNIYHVYGKANIEQNSSTDLQTLLTLLQNNPDLAIEIRSHTDSRGSNEFNINLSTQRAKAIVDFLIVNGVKENRLAYKGLGETELLNNCGDNSNCDDVQHGENRRTEFRVIKNK
jgi:outer membrane protein OmpA-like peptidoglycan-associated protein/tetratricopeptide (TPR) repeat protein